MPAAAHLHGSTHSGAARTIQDTLLPLCRQHEFEADAIGWAVLAQEGIPPERWAEVAVARGWPPLEQAQAGVPDAPSEGALESVRSRERFYFSYADELLKEAAKQRSAGNAGAAELKMQKVMGGWAAAKLLDDMPLTEKLVGAVQLLQTHPPDKDRAQHMQQLAARWQIAA